MPGEAGRRPRLQLALSAKRAKTKIGPYLVDTDTLNGTYLPPLLELAPGEDFEMKLDNQLQPPPAKLDMVEATLDPNNPNAPGHSMPIVRSDLNLHTHGLIVSPKNARKPGHDTLTTGRGDNIFATVRQGTSFDYDIDVPATLNFPGGKVAHPEGLFWYHPHIHGLAQRQLSAGLSGPIAIGSPIGYLRRMSETNVPFKDDAFTRNIETRTIVLKDILVAADKTPAEIKDGEAAEATWIGLKEAAGGATYPPEWAAGFLPTSCSGEAPAGWCEPDDSVPRPAGFKRKVVWMFTANGAIKPTVSIAKGHYALLRLVNESPTVTYDLTFGNDPEGGTLFYVVGIDGAMPGDAPMQNMAMAMRLLQPPREPAVKLAAKKSLLLLPASRADILIGGAQAPSTVTMFTRHVQMGVAAGDADEWPSAPLAQLAFAGDNVVPANPAFEPQFRIPIELSKLAPTKQPPAGCTSTVLDNTATKRQWRHVELKNNDTLFFISSKTMTQDAAGHVSDSDQIPAQTMPMMNDEKAWSNVKHVCVKQGSTEIWEIENHTIEMHNFHMHQSKFKVLRQPDDPTGKLEKFPIYNVGEPSDTNVWHDTFPVPPAAKKSDGTPDDANPGRILIAINFGADQQVGRFVFHCHILEHEDKGMMAPIEVVAADQ